MEKVYVYDVNKHIIDSKVIQKEEVINSALFYNTVGQELEEIFIANNLSVEKLQECFDLPITEVRKIVKLKKAQISEVCKCLGMSELESYLLSFQKDYIISTREAENKYKDYKMTFLLRSTTILPFTVYQILLLIILICTHG